MLKDSAADDPEPVELARLNPLNDMENRRQASNHPCLMLNIIPRQFH
jgi:hypothetical protein